MALPVGDDQLWAAWERVRENEGCAGADGVTVRQFADRAHKRLPELRDRVNAGLYRPLPLLKIVVEKHAGQAATRTLLVPAVRDRVLQTAVAHHLSRSFEEEFLECSFGYRPGRSVDRSIARIRKCRELGYLFVVDADIESFFSSVDCSSRRMNISTVRKTAPMRRGLKLKIARVAMVLLRIWAKPGGDCGKDQKVHDLVMNLPPSDDGLMVAYSAGSV